LLIAMRRFLHRRFFVPCADDSRVYPIIAG
jgi:hypothetical protein